MSNSFIKERPVTRFSAETAERLGQCVPIMTAGDDARVDLSSIGFERWVNEVVPCGVLFLANRVEYHSGDQLTVRPASPALFRRIPSTREKLFVAVCDSRIPYGEIIEKRRGMTLYIIMLSDVGLLRDRGVSKHTVRRRRSDPPPTPSPHDTY